VKLLGLRREDTAEGSRVAATVEWEDSGRPAREVRVEVAPALGPALAEELDGFAVAAAVVAQHHGERRLRVEGTLCPRLVEGLAAATRLLARWFASTAPAPVIECSRGTAPRFPPPDPRAAIFLSGGVDSLYAVARNREDCPRDHPASYRDAIVVDGYIFDAPDATPRARDYWRRTRSATSAFAAAAGLETIFVRTNLRSLDDDFGLFAAKGHAAFLAAIAHLLSRRVSSATIAAGLDVRSLQPWGSHPILDSLYSGSALSFRHEGIEAARVEKTERLARWPEALASLMVCTEGPLRDGSLNCGRCEKCLRTLAALGPAAAAAKFERTEVTPEAIRGADPGLNAWATARFWEELEPMFRARGDGARAAAAADLVARSRRDAAWGLDRGWKGMLRRFDRRFLGSNLLRARRRLRARRSP
jgi:hypothetical protein